MIGIYKITSPTGRIYIGQSNDIRNRIIMYKSLRCKNQPKIYRSLLKHGVESHTFTIEELCNVENLNERERYYQELYNCLDFGLNCSLVSTKEKKFVHSTDSKNKISSSRLGMKFSESHIENIRRIRTGTKSSEETKLKLSQINKGKTPPSWKGRVKTQEHMENIAKALRGRTKSISENINTSLSMLSKPLPYSDIIFDPFTGVYYYSIRDLARTMKCNASTLSRRLKTTSDKSFKLMIV